MFKNHVDHFKFKVVITMFFHSPFSEDGKEA